MAILHRLMTWSIRQLGGRASAWVVAVFALVLAVEYAQWGAIGAMARQLEQALAISKVQLGLLLTASSLTGALGTLPFGWLVDRTNRTQVLAAAIALWGLAMTVCATATSYTYLLVASLALGGIMAAAIPAIASLTGDFFAPHVRGRMYGYMLSGQLFGIGFGFLIAGELALLSWRVGFLALAVPAFLLAWLVHRVPEPARGGTHPLQPGQEHFGDRPPADRAGAAERVEPPDQSGIIRALIREAQIRPRAHLIFAENPQGQSLLWAAWYVLHIPTNLVLIIASALGYYFFAGMSTFGVEFVHDWFGLPHSAAIGLVVLFGSAGLAGAIFGGRLGDVLLARGHLSARITVAMGGYLAAGVFLVPTLLTHSLTVAVPVLLLAGIGLGAVNPPLDAARLDIMHPYLWGRAEAVRSALRLMAQALAPLLFGYIAEHAFGGGAAGLQRTFLVMLIPLFVSGGIGFIAFHTYPRDVATAEAYTRRTHGQPDETYGHLPQEERR